MDVPVLVSRDIVVDCFARQTDELRGGAPGYWREVARSMASLLGRAEFDRRFRAHCLAYLSEGELTGILDEVQAAAEAASRTGGRADSPWARRPSEVSTHLCGEGATVSEPHSDHAWFGELMEACQDMMGWSVGPRALQWRPGESTMLLSRLLPKAEIVCIELPGCRARNWSGACEAVGAELYVLEGETYWKLPPSIRSRRFDLVLIGGVEQEKCRRTAEGLLGPGGRILMNRRADAQQVPETERERGGRRPAGKAEESRPRAAGAAQRTGNTYVGSTSEG